MLRELLVVLLLSSFVISHLHPSPCDHETVMEKFFNENPEEEERTHAFALQMREAAQRYLSNMKEASAPVTIPVVFHILYAGSNTTQRITPASVAAEINYMNQWYSATNTNYAKTSNYWASVKAVASDYKISFALATKDPNGNPTNGIIYHESTVTGTCGDTEIFKTASGGADAWNTLNYMNVWTCPLTTGAAGYAYLPSTGTHYRDGIVMAPQYIGYAYASGSLLAHEAGHWLGLPHTFTGTSGSCNVDNDNVADTPKTDVPVWNYNSNVAACANAQNGMRDADFQRCGNIVQVQNCMDYNYEECKSFFTKGQVAVMRSYLDNASSVRGGLKTSPALGSQSCTPNCANKFCGSNGCGGVCGTCLSGSTCSVDGICGVGGPAPPAASASPSPSPVAVGASPSPSPTRSPAAQGSSSVPSALIVQKINTVRASVNPLPAAPLTSLTYSTTLENQAKTTAQSCGFSLSSGQTGYIIGGDQTGNLNGLFTQVIDLWEAQKQYYTLTSTTGTCASGQNCGGYVQMVWNHASYPTTQVGCFASYCPTPNSINFAGTFVVCQFAGPGNYIGLLPYQVCTSAGCNPACPTGCSVGQCGIISTPCGNLDCGPCCDDPCATHQCGSHLNSCGTSINCGNCESGFTCNAGADGNNVCVAEPVCVHAEQCAANGYECGNQVYCGVNAACGYCGSGEICSDYQCVADPCAGCGVNSQCVNNQCSCLAGYVLQNGGCVQPSVGIDYTNMFAQTFPTGSVDFVIPQNDLLLTAGGPHILKWVTSENVVDLYTTKTSISVTIPSGEFGFNIRHGQDTDPNDRIMWHVKGIGSNPTVAVCIVYYGTSYCSAPYQPISFPTTAVNVTVTMGFDGTFVLTSFKVGSDSPWSTGIDPYYVPSLGAVSYFISGSGSPNPVLSKAILSTSATLTVSLVDCIDDTQWASMFYTLTGANPATTSVTVRADGEDGNCKGVSANGKFVASGFTVVVTSTAVPAASLVSTLTSSVGTPTGAALGIVSAAAVPGAAGANAAGFATTIGALGGTTVVAPAVAGGGGGGGGAAGLSGGAIAGIVIGSVAGAVLIVGVTTVVVAAVIVAAVVVAKKAGSDDSPSVSDSGPTKSEARTSRRIRDTLYDIFRAPKGGVDVMNNPSGHQSITARAPQA